MYGWRGRLGVILPYDNCVLEPEFARVLPDGVTAHVIRALATERAEIPAEGMRLARALLRLRPRAALYACLATSFMNGAAFHDELHDTLRRETGLPTETASSAMVAALRELGIQRVAVATPYPEWLNERLVAFFDQKGLTTHCIKGLGLEPEEINLLWPDRVYSLVRSLPTGGADGVFICATNFRTLEVLQALENDLRLPVVSANQALVWAGLCALGVRENLPGYGSLLMRVAAPVPAG